MNKWRSYVREGETVNAPQPPVPEPDAACDPHRGEPTQNWGLQRILNCVKQSSKNGELCLRKVWEKCVGWMLIHPTRPK